MVDGRMPLRRMGRREKVPRTPRPIRGGRSPGQDAPWLYQRPLHSMLARARTQASERALVCAFLLPEGKG